MNDPLPSFRFSLRSLFLVTVACSALLLEWKHWGVASPVGTVTTLAVGGGFLALLKTRRWNNRRRLTLGCVVLTFGNIALIETFVDFWSWGFYSASPSIVRSLDNEIWLTAHFASLLLATVLAVGTARMMMGPNWSLSHPMLILINGWFGLALVAQLSHPYYNHTSEMGSNLLRGFATALIALGITLLLRKINSLPTTREELSKEEWDHL